MATRNVLVLLVLITVSFKHIFVAGDASLARVLSDLSKKIDRLIGKQGEEEDEDTTAQSAINPETLESFRAELAAERTERKQMEQRYVYLEQRVAAALRGFQRMKLERINLLNRLAQFQRTVSNATEQSTLMVEDVRDLIEMLDKEMGTRVSECQESIDVTRNDVHELASDVQTLQTDTVRKIEQSMVEVNSTIQEYVKTQTGLTELHSNASIAEVVKTVNAVLPRLMVFLRNTSGAGGGGGMGLPCNATDACWVTNSECRIGQCSCRPLYSFDPGSSRCVSSCINYGTTFQRLVGQAFISSIGARMFQKTADECETHCLKATFFQCKSFLYDTTRRSCYLFSGIPDKSKQRHVPVGSRYEYYQRDCE